MTAPLFLSIHAVAYRTVRVPAKLPMATMSLASLGCDLFTDPELLKAAKADFVARKGDYVFKSAIDADMKRPSGLDAIEAGCDHLHHLRCHDTGHDQHLEHLEDHIKDMHGH